MFVKGHPVLTVTQNAYNKITQPHFIQLDKKKDNELMLVPRHMVSFSFPCILSNQILVAILGLFRF